MKIFVSHSSKTEETRALRDVVAHQLDKEPDIEVLWDQTFRPGQSWRAELDQWLAECDGGVILFSEDSLQSSWVLKEAQILTWRRTVAGRFLLIPVLLEPVTKTATRMDDWSPVKVSEIQFLPGGNPLKMKAADRETIANEIVEIVRTWMGAQPENSSSDPIVTWTNHLGKLLRLVDPDSLKEMARALGLADDLPPDDNASVLARLLAYRLLHFGSEPLVAGVSEETFENAAKALKETVFTLTNENRERVAKQFFPVWVNPEAARHVVAASLFDEAPWIVAINGTEHETGEFYARRATCGDVTDLRIVKAPDLHDGDPDLIFQAYDEKLRRVFRLDNVTDKEEQMKARITNYGPVFIVLYGEACRPSVLEKLIEKYWMCTFILMLGGQTRDPEELGFTNCRMVEPLLPDRRDIDIATLYDEFLAT